VDAAALPGGVEDPLNGRAQAAVGIRDDQLGVPSSPRALRLRRKSIQKVSASDGPSPRPMISRRPSVFAATAIMAATETILPP